MKKIVLFFLIGLLAWGATVPVHAIQCFGPPPDSAPSVFAYGFRGFWIGTALGSSAGYLVIRDDHWNGNAWEDLGISMGVGAIVGTLGGLGVGLYDLSLEKPGVGSIVLRDTLYGTGLGGLVGAVAGGLFVIKSDDWEDVALGASVGSLVGAAVGIAMGFIEGPKVVDMYSKDQTEGERVASGPSWSLGMKVLKDRNRNPVYLPVVTKRF